MHAARRSLLCSALGLYLMLIGAGCRAAERDPEPPRVPVPYYRDTGGASTRALVLVHGWAGSTEAWTRQFPDYARFMRVLAVDLPGHGQSALPRDGYSVANFADSIAAAMDDAGVRDAVLVGHSNGVPVIAEFSRRHPRRTAGLIGIDGALKSMFDAATLEGFIAPLRGADWQAAIGAMIDGMPGPNFSDRDRAAVKATALATDPATVIGSAEAMLDPAAFSTRPIKVPLLLVLARQPLWNDDYEEFVRELAPQVDYRVWRDVGHYIQFERTDELREVVGEFLRANALLP